MTRKLLSLSIFILAISPILFGQNLIPNPGFEDVNVCYKYHEECSPKAWRSTVLKNFAYREYLGESKRRKLPGKKRPTIIPPEGSRYVAIRIFNKIRENDRTFIQAPLLCELQTGKIYEVRLQVYSTTYMIDELGIALIDTMQIFKKNDAVFKIDPQVKIRFDKKIKPNQWHKISATFVATGQERGLIIGNFNVDNNTEIKTIVKIKEKDQPKAAHYILDDFSLLAFEQDSSTHCNIERNRKFIYEDSIRHIIYEKVKSIADIPQLKEILIPVKDREVTIEEDHPQKEEHLTIGDQEINIKEDFVFSTITFENNKAVLQVSAFRPLEEIANFLNQHPEFQMQITGHTDNVGRNNFNQNLSVQRARVVADFLIRNGVKADRLVTAGRGELEPVDTNDTTLGRQQNRRVAFKILL